jgi:hypothetical protein
MRIAPSDFLPDEAKNAGNTLCINEYFGKIWRKDMPASKGSVPDACGEILNRLSYKIYKIQKALRDSKDSTALFILSVNVKSQVR